MKALKLFLVCGFFIISVNAFSKIDVPPHPDSLNKIKEKVIANAPKLISQESFISKYNWYKKVYDDPNSFTKKKNLRERCLLSAYCDYYNELMEYDAVSLILNIVYRGITANVEAGPKESSVNAVDDLNF